jgi:glycosyltransferase involved in cell wall biosynthesis
VEKDPYLYQKYPLFRIEELMKMHFKSSALNVGLLFRNMNIAGGQVPVAVGILESIKLCGLNSTVICGKKLDKDIFRKRWGINIMLDRELVLPMWPTKIQVYFQFLLPYIVANFCDILINPWTSDILPGVDITYIHGPKLSILQQRARKNNFWSCYYAPYIALEHALSSTASTRKKLVLANSFFTAHQFKKQTGIQPEVLYPPVDLPKFDFEQSLTYKRNIVLSIARFSPDKNLEMIPSIARHVNALFVILGTISNWAVLHRLNSFIKKYELKDKVILLVNDPNNYATKNKLLQKAKVFLSTSFFEPFGITLVEGMGAGCITVSHDSGGPREFVPYEWRYKDEEEAIMKVNEALKVWSPSIAADMRNIAYRFNKSRFVKDFSKKLKLYLEEVQDA